MTTIEQTVEIPASRRLTLDISLPETIPLGTARVAIIVSAPEAAIGTPPRLRLLPDENARKYPTLLSMLGSCKGRDTLDEYFLRKKADKTHEQQRERTYS
ncbi:MAG: hypothetical protein Ta2A_23980 [Treponemataceae bacterium]|nr:MAG: hypothetical protein Ta2A_23980 [Treponemataceae bacterium]